MTWLLRIIGCPSTPPFMALSCPGWRSRPQHQIRTSPPGFCQRFHNLPDAVDEKLRHRAECPVFQCEKTDGLFCRWQSMGKVLIPVGLAENFNACAGQHGQEMTCG